MKLISLRDSKGLTLIEVLVAIALLAFISIAISQATIGSFRLNSRLGSESNDYTTILMSMQAVENDLTQIYSVPLFEAKPVETNEQPTEFWGVKIRSDGFRRTRLKGNMEKLTFVTNQNRRLERDSPQSDFLKVTWEVERNASGAYTLYRSTDWNVYNLLETRETKVPRVALISNLSSAKFTYYRSSNKTWEEQWDTENPYAKLEELYPDLIALEISVPNPVNNAAPPLIFKLIAKPNLPLNYFEKKATSSVTDPNARNSGADRDSPPEDQ